MGKDFFVTVAAKAGLAGEYEPLTEAEFASAPSGPYVPTEDGVFRTVPTTAGRTIQLLQSSPVFIETFQSSDAVVRMPSGLMATNDAEDGRFYFFRNNGQNSAPADGIITIEDHNGNFIATIAQGDNAIIIHGEDDNWDFFPIASTGPGTDGFGGVFRYTASSGVPGGGTRFLETGSGFACSSAGDRLISNVNITGISIRIDVADLARDYQVQVVTNPSGVSGPTTTVATLDLPSGSVSEGRNDLAVFVTAPTEIGARLVRTAGGGSSTFRDINVLVQVG
jgi:hypothetical protein